MPRRGLHSKEELESLIFSSAKKLLIKKGLKNLSARKLAAEIDYTPGTIYSFFKNIDELVMHINAESLETLYMEFLELYNNCKSPKKALTDIAQVYIKFYEKNQALWSALFEYNYKSTTKIPKWYKEQVKKIFDLLAELINSASNKKINAENLARVFWAGLHGIIALTHNRKLAIAGVTTEKVLVKDFIDNFTKGI